MSRIINYIENLGSKQRSLLFKVRVVRMWRQPSFIKLPSIGDSLEMVLVDEKGDRVQATIKHCHVAKFEERLKEMEVYYIRDFTVMKDAQIYKTCRNAFRIYFKSKTVLQRCDSPLIPKYGLALTEFSRIEDASNNNKYLIDIVGIMVSVSELHEDTTDDKSYKYVTVQLDNLRGMIVKCILRDNFAEQILQYVEMHNNGPYVLVLQFVRIQHNFGEIEVMDNKYSSRLLINPDTIELLEFRSRLDEDQVARPQIRNDIEENQKGDVN